LKDEHDRHQHLLKEIVDKHQLHHVAKSDILGVHYSNGVVVENVAERTHEVAEKIEVKERMDKEMDKAVGSGEGYGGGGDRDSEDEATAIVLSPSSKHSFVMKREIAMLRNDLREAVERRELTESEKNELSLK
jgi:hypothetical protein